MTRIFKITTFFLILFFITTSRVYAESSYVLPYPSTLPGGLSYKIHLIYEKLLRYWYFGDFGQLNYGLKMADKYLVEAKTLFEYKQYLLGHIALKKSDQYFINILPYLKRAEKDGKNILQKKIIFKQASQKHIEVLKEMEKTIPDIFIWQPEKLAPTTLNLKKNIKEAIKIRQKSL